MQIVVGFGHYLRDFLAHYFALIVSQGPLELRVRVEYDPHIVDVSCDGNYAEIGVLSELHIVHLFRTGLS